MFSCQCDRCSAVISDILYRIIPRVHRFQVIADEPYLHPVDETTQTTDLCTACYHEFQRFSAPLRRADSKI
ncbi:MAG: hypothetical protein ACRDIE_11315 [Chloroflexota bacterium]